MKSGYFWQGELVRLRHFREEDAERKVEELYESEGRIRREIFTNNRFYDLLRFGLLKEEFGDSGSK